MRNRVTRSLYGQLNNEQSNERVMFDCRTVKNRMTGLLCSFALLRPTERTEIFMKTIIQIPRIPLFTEIEEPQSYAIYIFGTDNRLLQDADTFGDAHTLFTIRMVILLPKSIHIGRSRAAYSSITS